MFMSHIKSRHDIINFSKKKELSLWFAFRSRVERRQKSKKILTSINFCTNRSAIMNAWDVNNKCPTHDFRLKCEKNTREELFLRKIKYSGAVNEALWLSLSRARNDHKTRSLGIFTRDYW
jgi:hypothetical protein